MRVVAAGLLGALLFASAVYAGEFSPEPRVPSDERALARSAERDCDAGRYDAAAAKYEAIASKYPNCADAWSSLGMARSEQGDLGSACRAFRQAAHLCPHDPVALMNLGVCYFELHKYDAAIPPFEHAEEINPGNSNVHAYLARCYQKVGRLVEAEKERQAENVGQMDTYR